MRRRDFISLIGGVMAPSLPWPRAARAQQGTSVRRIGALMGYSEYDPEAKANLARFAQALAELGWIDRRNVQMEVRWAASNADRIRAFAKELVGLAPEVILTSGTAVTAGLRQETQTIPIVFTVVGDPVGEGFVAALRRPETNITGFISQEASMASKWVELLMKIAPEIERIAIMFNPDTAPGGGSYYWPSFEAAARSLRVEPIAAPVHSDAEIESFTTSFGREPAGGLVVMPENFTVVHRAQIVSSVTASNLPAVYGVSAFAREGGLVSYGPDYKDNFRRAALYVDRILHGAKPAELPVQVPVKFELVINLKAAKARGLVIPPTLLALADEVIE
jgi:putative tryptophan/tyrosine transport system substrate-binding protein